MRVCVCVCVCVCVVRTSSSTLLPVVISISGIFTACFIHY